MADGFSEDIVEHAGIENPQRPRLAASARRIHRPGRPCPQRQSFSETYPDQASDGGPGEAEPTVPEGARDEAIRKLVTSETRRWSRRTAASTG